MHNFLFIFLFYLPINSSNTKNELHRSRQNANVDLEVICHKNDSERNITTFFLMITNVSDKKVNIPDRFVGAELNNGQCNIEYEILYLEKDSINLTKEMFTYINIGSEPKNSREISAYKKYIFDLDIHNYFKRKGRYSIRFVLKKRSLIGEITDISNDIWTRSYSFQL